MKTSLPATLLKATMAVFFFLTLHTFSFRAEAQQVPIIYYDDGGGYLCAGSDITFSFYDEGGDGCSVHYWYVYGYDYTIVYESSSSITVRWNSPQSSAGVEAYYDCYNYTPDYYTSVYPLAITGEETPTVSLNHTAAYATPGQTVSFQATPTNAGTSPYYNWYVNGTYVAGGNASTYSFSQTVLGTYTVTCYLHSSAPCTVTPAQTSATVTVAQPPEAPYAYGNVMLATLPNNNITATSYAGPGHEPWLGRLFDQSGSSNWSAGANNLSQYLNIDLGENRQVEGIITQGRHNCCPQWVTGYTLSYSLDGNTWTNHSQTFTANTDMQTSVANTVSSPFIARYVRIHPTGWNQHITMRAEIVSVPFGASSVTFVASLPAGANSSRWYEAPSGGTPVHTGSSFTATLPAEKTYYVSSYHTATGLESYTRTPVTGRIRLLENMNHVMTNTVNVEGVNTAQEVYLLSAESDRRQQKTYLDHLGRPLQQVMAQGSAGKNDIVAHMAYDALNREAISYLPYTSGNDGMYKANALTAQPSFYQTAKADNKAFAGSRFESSPLGRVIEQGAPGTAWQLAATPEGGKTNKLEYSKNVADEIRLWYYNLSTKTATSTTFYPADALYKTVATDEHGMKRQEYKDKSGKVVCTKVQKIKNNESSYLFTYYVYDDFSNLRFVVPPQAVNELGTVNHTFAYDDAFCRKWLFAYQYDERWRTTEKSVPGGGITFLVYDPLDRVVLTQDAVERVSRHWKFVKYDVLGRAIMSGRYTHSTQETQAGMQQAVDNHYAASPAPDYYERRSSANFSSLFGYTNQAFPLLASGTYPNLVNYYDDYDFDYNGTLGETGKLEPVYVNFGAGYTASPGPTRGKQTGSRIRVLGSSTWLASAVYYDAWGRVVQTQKENYHFATSGFLPSGTGRTLEVVATQYDFEGKVLRTEQRHCNALSNNTYTLRIRQRYVYDHAGRVKEHYHRVNEQAEERLALYSYNELGELVQKVTGNNLQTVDYAYNIRGWMKSVNEGHVTGTGAGADVFALSYKHEDASYNPQYNGNISSYDWISKTDNVRRGYEFGYDGLNRLNSGWYSSDNWEEQFSAWTLYDDNGNITHMQRQNLLSYGANGGNEYGDVDYLPYTYDGNRLKSVDDGYNFLTTASRDFKEKSRTNINPTEFTYDAAGRLTSDKNRGIQSIYYNELGYPDGIYMSEGLQEVLNVYDATGAKILTSIIPDGSELLYYYIGGVVYFNDVPQFIPTAEGRVLSPQASGSTTWQYEYHYRDHLGSTRVAYRPSPNVTHTAGMEQETNPAWSNAGSPVRNSERASSGSYSAKLTTSYPLGPWKTVKINKGDVVTVAAYGSYTQAPTNNSAVALIPYVETLGAQSTESGNSPYRLKMGLAITPILIPGNNWSSTVPKAFLQYILTDSKGNVTHSKRRYITTLANNAWESMSMSYTAETEGYLQLLVANESDRAVWFDEVQLTVNPGLIVQETHYDPWGLELAGIEGRGSPEHKFQFQGKELTDEIGLYLMDFHARQYDAQLGRWHAPDPQDQFASPYAAMGNNPVMYVDPDGEWVQAAIGAALGAYSGYKIGQASGATGWSMFGYIAGGAAIGAISGGIGMKVASVVSSGIGGVTGGIIGTTVGAGMAGGVSGGGMAALSGGDMRQGFINGAVAGLAAGAVGAGLGVMAPSFSNASLAGRYAGKAVYAGLTGSVTAGAGMLASDLADNGQLNLSGSDYLRGMGNGAALGGAISLGYSAYDYATWDRHSASTKIALLNKEFNTNVIQHDPNNPDYGGYTWGQGDVKLGDLALSNRAIARNTVAHELDHLSAFQSGVPFNRNSLEHRAHLLDMKLATSHGLPGRYWSESRSVLRTHYSYNGPFPRTYSFRQIWYNIFR